MLNYYCQDTLQKSRDVNKESRLKARTKDYRYVLKDNQEPAAMATSLFHYNHCQTVVLGILI